MQGNARGISQKFYNEQHAEEEERLIQKYDLDVRMCVESGIYEGEKHLISAILNKASINNKIKNYDDKKMNHTGRGTI